MHFSISKVMLELAFLKLKDKGFLYEGPIHYSELRKNTLKDFLKEEWKWNKRQVIKAIKEWRRTHFIELVGDDHLVFKFTQVVKKTNSYISEIEREA